MSSQKSPCVNNLISFWSDLESPDPTSSGQRSNPNPNPGGFQPARFRGPQSILNLSQNRATGASPNPTAAASTASPQQRRPLPLNSAASSPSLLTSLPKNSAPGRGSAPLFPLRSVAPAQTRVFGTQRHALDTINTRPLQSPSEQPVSVSNRPSGPRAAHHNSRPHPVSTNPSPRPGRISSSPASEATNETATDRKTAPKRVGNISVSSSESSTPQRRIEGFHPSARGASVPSLGHDLNQQRELQSQIRPKASPSYSSSSSTSSAPEFSSAQQPLSSSTPLSPTRQQSEGILKLAVIPPVQTKDEALQKHHHLARSHPMVSNSDPLGQPIDVLLPLGKLTFVLELVLPPLFQMVYKKPKPKIIFIVQHIGSRVSLFQLTPFIFFFGSVAA